jgi:hypothetical protein
MIHAYLNLNQCFNSKENVLKEHSFDAINIKNIHFDIVSGFVGVYFDNRSTIDIKIWDKSRSGLHRDVNTFDSGIKTDNHSINIHSYSPAFDLKSCHHAEVEIYIPTHFHKLISLSGTVKLGYVQIEGDGVNNRKFSSIDITVEMGAIEVLKTILSDSLTLKTDIGAIDVLDVIAPQSVNLQTHTGSINTNIVITKKYNAVNTFGCSIHQDVVADVVEITTKYGYSHFENPTTFGTNLDIIMNTEYGHSKLYLTGSNVDFHVNTKKGEVIIDEDDGWTCKIEKSSLTSSTGKCTLDSSSSITTSKVNMFTQYGEAELIIETPIEDIE